VAPSSKKVVVNVAAVVAEPDTSPQLSKPDSSTTVQERGTGVCMDLSSMFSDSSTNNNKQTSSETKVSPPPHLLKRLQRQTESVKVKERSVPSWSKGRATPLSTKVVNKLKPVPKQQSVETPPQAVEPETRGNGAFMDFSNVFSDDSTSKQQSVTKGIPPPALLKRLQQRQTKPVKPKESSVQSSKGRTKSISTKVVNKPKPVPKQSVETPPKAVEPEKRGNGALMDFSNVFSDSTSKQQSVTKATPPPALLKRLQQKTKPVKVKESSVQSSKGRAIPLSTKVVNKLKPAPKQSVKIAPKPKVIQPRVRKTMLSKGAVRTPRAQTGETSTPAATAQQRRNVPRMEFFNVLSDSTNKQQSIGSLTTNSEGARKVHAQSTPQTTKHRNGHAFDIPASQRSHRMTSATATTPKTASSLTMSNNKNRSVDGWAETQCDAFVGWLNYTFQPTEDDDDDNDNDNGNVANSGPSSRSGLRTLLVHRRLAQVRMRASELFHGQAMRKIKNVVQAEICKGRLSIRSDRDLHADLSLRKQATSLLLSYTTPWLRMALEVMFGECIEADSFQQDTSSMPVAGQMVSIIPKPSTYLSEIDRPTHFTFCSLCLRLTRVA
jgi:hypothetical protein